MKYYEIWFYFYGENDERTDYTKEFTFYIKTEQTFNSDQELIQYLAANFSPSERYHTDTLNCIDSVHYPYLSKWFEIGAEEFTDGCGISA